MTRPPSSRFAGASHTYEICSQDGTPQALHVRYPPGVRRKRKSFLWFQPDGETKGLNGRPVHTLPFYRSECLKDLDPGDQVVITEGEKAADALWAFGIVALGTVTGSSTKIPADDAVLGSLTGFDVAVWPDVGTGGQKHMDLLLKDLYRVRGSAEGLSVVDNTALGLIESGADAADWRPDDAVGDLRGALRPWCPSQPSIEPAAAAAPGKASTAGSERVFFPQGKTRAGLVAALDHLGFDLRYNERSSRLEILDVGAEHPTWNETDDMLRSSIRERIGERCSVFNKVKERVPMTLTSRRFVELTDAVLDARRVDPFKEWLNNLPVWDKEPRLDLWLYGCFAVGEIDADLMKWACYSVPMAAVWRADHPGEKHDEMVILVGPQGLGKSTVWAWLLPKEHRAQWFSDGLRFLAEPKAQVESLQGRVIVEASEMSGSTRADVETIKAFLSRMDDGSVRLTYRRDPVLLPRRCVIVGSTNDPRCLPNDPSGNRRFVPVPVSKGSVPKIRVFMDEHREQLWAEALYRVRVNREPAYLPHDLAQTHRDHTEHYRAADEIAEDVIQDWLSLNPGPVTLEAVAEGIKWSNDRRSMARIINVLKQFGYVCGQRSGRGDGLKRYWVKDDGVPRNTENES